MHAPPVGGVVLSMWRAVVVFRVLALLLAVSLIVRWRDLYARPAVAFAVAAAMVAVTAAVAVRALAGRAHRIGFVTADLVVTVALTLATRWAQTPPQYHGGMLTLTSIWAAGPVLEAGLLLGTAGGLGAAVVQFGASVVVRGGLDDGRTLLNGALLLIVGGLLGYVTRLLVRAERERAELAADRARLDEQNRLARSIHDGVLQVLGLVHRRGTAAGGEWAELAEEAAIQEEALRSLISSAARAPSVAGGQRSLAADLGALRSSRVRVALPDAPVALDAEREQEIVAAVRAALANVEQHAGPGATAWVLLEAEPDRVVVSIRDDGVGIAAGRLDEAIEQGRLGVAKSIRGRIGDLGGIVAVTSAPGSGTEIELAVPR